MLNADSAPHKRQHKTRHYTCTEKQGVQQKNHRNTRQNVAQRPILGRTSLVCGASIPARRLLITISVALEIYPKRCIYPSLHSDVEMNITHAEYLYLKRRRRVTLDRDKVHPGKHSRLPIAQHAHDDDETPEDCSTHRNVPNEPLPH